MRCAWWCVCLAAIAAVAFGCARQGGKDPEAAGSPSPEVPRALVDGNTAFALDLYSKLRSGEGNIFLSPFSVSVALAMAYGGAGGETATEMGKVLHFTMPSGETHAGFGALRSALTAAGSTEGIRLRLANASWLDKHCKLRPEYTSLLRQWYGATPQTADFSGAPEEALQAINAWVARETEEKIRELIRRSDLSRETTLVLVNAVYFKGMWASKFPQAGTREQDFTVPRVGRVRVPMMFQKKKFGYAEVGDVKVLEMPYVGKRLAMVVLLPQAADGLPRLEQGLSMAKLRDWLGQLTECEVNVSLPKFRIEWGTTDLVKPLQALGMRKAFEPGAADFPGLADCPSFITHVLHKSYVDVGEEGTEAAAATGVMMARSVSLVKSLRADHPFLFLLRDRQTGSILFLGRLVDPRVTK